MWYDIILLELSLYYVTYIATNPNLGIKKQKKKDKLKEKVENKMRIQKEPSPFLAILTQQTNSHKLSYAGKPQMRAICIYVGCTKMTTND